VGTYYLCQVDEEEELEGEDEDEKSLFKKTTLKNVSTGLLVCAIVLLMVDRKNFRRHCYNSHP
jgi:hypothetical protein